MDKSLEKKNYLQRVGRELDLDNPQSFTEKLCWKKFYDRNPLITVTSDKGMVRDYISGKGCGEYLAPILGIYDDPQDIPFDRLKNHILKCNHASGWNMVIRDGQFERENIQRQFKSWLSRRWAPHTQEWGYTEIKPQVVVEEYLGGDLRNVKLYMFHGQCRLLIDETISLQRKPKHRLRCYNADWTTANGQRAEYELLEERPKPDNLSEMINIAEKLSEPFDFVRVDLYEVDGKVYCGEMTHYPGAGWCKFSPTEYDFELGGYWHIDEGERKLQGQISAVADTYEYDYTILSVCVGDFYDAFDITVPTWLNKGARVIVYTDKPCHYEGVEIRPVLPRTESWVEAVGLKAKAVKSYLATAPNEKLVFLDMDCAVVSDLSGVFKKNFEMAVCKLDGSETVSSGTWYAQVNDNVRKFADKWVDLQADYFRKGKGVQPRKVAYDQYGFNDALATVNTEYLDNETWNNRKSIYKFNREKWKQGVKTSCPKVIHFVQQEFREPGFVSEMMSLAKVRADFSKSKFKIITWFWQQNGVYDYSYEDVNRWAKEIELHTSIPHTLACVTDIPEGIREDVEIIPTPQDCLGITSAKWVESSGRPQCFRRLALYAPWASDIFGPRFVSMDMDCKVLGNMDEIFSRDEDFVITPGTGKTNYYNGSMQMLKAGARPQVYNKLSQEEFDKAKIFFAGSDQCWLAYALGGLEATFTKEEGVYIMFPHDFKKLGDQRPDNCRIMFLPGNQKEKKQILRPEINPGTVGNERLTNNDKYRKVKVRVLHTIKYRGVNRFPGYETEMAFWKTEKYKDKIQVLEG